MLVSSYEDVQGVADFLWFSPSCYITDHMNKTNTKVRNESLYM